MSRLRDLIKAVDLGLAVCSPACVRNTRIIYSYETIQDGKDKEPYQYGLIQLYIETHDSHFALICYGTDVYKDDEDALARDVIDCYAEDILEDMLKNEEYSSIWDKVDFETNDWKSEEE